MSRKISPPDNPFAWIGWALLGNEDDPVYGDKAFNPEQEDTLWWRVKWWFRNPIHNFTFYVIGVAHLETTRTGRYPQDVFAPDGGWNWAVTHYKRLRLPFVSYNGAVKFYIGWRERGNFGVKLTRGARRKE